MANVRSAEDIKQVLAMLDKCMEISVMACTAYANLKGNPAYQFESLPELLRAQEQNATAMIVQAKRIWEFVLNEDNSRGRGS